MSRLVSIAAELSAPPSSSSCFRDVELTAYIRGYEIIAVVPDAAYTFYLNWMRARGLLNYLEELLPDHIVISPTPIITIVGGPRAKLTAHNVHEVLSYLT